VETREVLLLFRCFKNLPITYGKGRTGDSHPITNEWGGEWVVSSQVRVVPEPKEC
jgi:hypothetical protein